MPKTTKPTPDATQPKSETRKPTKVYLDREVLADIQELESRATRAGDDFPSLTDLINTALREWVRRQKTTKTTL